MTRREPVTEIFATLDRWRHLPAYQLERRADIFFAVYLHEVAEAFLGVELDERIIPEFPLKLDLISEVEDSRQSVKVDYLLVSRDRKAAYLVEFKTDGGSRRDAQDAYLEQAVRVGFPAILAGIKDIALASQYKSKYGHLLHALAELGFVELPEDLGAYLHPKPRPGASARLRKVAVTDAAPELHVLYLQPKQTEGDRCIDFAFVKTIVDRYDDPFSRSFAAHLERWVEPAGAPAP